MAQIFQSSFNPVAQASLASIVPLIVAVGGKTYAGYCSLCTTAEVARLREQLTGPRESFQTALQELEESRGEYRSAHEEVLSSNEELTALNNDLQNLLNCVDIPLAILDPNLRPLLEQFLTNNSCFFDFEVEQVSPHLGRKRVLLNARRLEWEGKVPSPMSLLAIEEVTGHS